MTDIDEIIENPPLSLTAKTFIRCPPLSEAEAMSGKTGTDFDALWPGIHSCVCAVIAIWLQRVI
jgi:hypothetical protein